MPTEYPRTSADIRAAIRAQRIPATLTKEGGQYLIITRKATGRNVLYPCKVASLHQLTLSDWLALCHRAIDCAAALDQNKDAYSEP